MAELESDPRDKVSQVEKIQLCSASVGLVHTHSLLVLRVMMMMMAFWSALGPSWRPPGRPKAAQRRPKRLPNGAIEALIFIYFSMVFLDF